MTSTLNDSMFNRAIQWIHANHIDGAAIPVTHRNRQPYQEVTGYFIPTLLAIGEVEMAEKFARFLVRVQNDDGSFWLDHPSCSYVFDTGQVIRGWVAIIDRLPELRKPLARACAWIMQGADPINGRLSTPAAGGAWSLGARGEVSEGIHLYVLKPLRDAATILGDPQVRACADKALKYYLENVQTSDFARSNMLTHFYGYIQEALFELGYIDKAREGMASAAAFQNESGAVPAYFDVPWVCSTGLAQFAIVWYLLDEGKRADRALAFVAQLQNSSGGFFGSYGVGANYFNADEIPWAVKYAIEAEQLRIARHFDRTAHEYAPTIPITDGRVQAILSEIGEVSRVLDAGCGKGRYAALIKQYRPSAKVFAVDVSVEMLRHVPDGIETQVASIQDLPYADGSFDLVICVEALEHVPNPQGALVEMARVLAPGGRLLIIDKNRAKQGSLQIENWEHWFDVKELSDSLSSIGLSSHAEFIGYEGRLPDGLFVVWRGEKAAVNNISKIQTIEEEKMKKLGEFHLDSASGVWMPTERKSFDYSDGEMTEKLLLAKLMQAADLSSLSNELEALIWDWPSEYHFTQKRGNLLRHMSFEANAKILELGGGCGAITRFLGETGASVHMVEGSFNRASCAAARNRDQKNVRVHCSNFDDVEFEPIYDYVILIGVFEYSALFGSGDDPFQGCLKKIKTALKPNGKVIIAIENRNGLKYFNGCSEDHVSKPFVGITNGYEKIGPQTFGRKEIKDILLQGDFGYSEFHYPFPDYKVPDVVLTEFAFQTKGFMPANLMGQTRSRDYCRPHVPLFNEELTWPQLTANGMAEDMANSFLIIAANVPFKSVCELGLAFSYNQGERPDYLRKNSYKTVTEFHRCAQDNTILVDKYQLINSPSPEVTLIHCLSKGIIYSTGSSLTFLMQKALSIKNSNGFLGYVREWLDYLLTHGLTDSSRARAESFIKSDFFECTPSNLIATRDGLVFIDIEWHFPRPYTVRDLILRGLVHFCNDYATMTQEFFGLNQPAVLLIAEAVGIPATQADLNRMLEWENEFYSQVFDRA